jgi:hypothetical protein
MLTCSGLILPPQAGNACPHNLLGLVSQALLRSNSSYFFAERWLHLYRETSGRSSSWSASSSRLVRPVLACQSSRASPRVTR